MAAHGGPQAYGAVRSLSKDRSVARHQLAPGTIKRIGGFARPYRLRLTLFVSLILLEAGLGAMTPLVWLLRLHC